MKKIVILGSTGSIGTQTLEVVRVHPAEFQVIALSTHDNTELFERQVREFSPRHVVQTSVSENPEAALCALATLGEADIIVNALAGHVGLMPTFAACKAGKRIALANKESLVMAGELIMKTASQFGAEIVPIDSEPSAVWQALLLRGHVIASEAKQSRLDGFVGLRPPRHDIEKIILTASGGPFWKRKKEELAGVSVAEALKHPTWKMGEKISIDSATLMNKAFEIIETRWLFDIPPAKIDVTIHRQSLVHAMVQYVDGTTTAILSQPDMRIPISYALFGGERALNTFPRMDFSALNLTFEKPDYSLFEGPRLAYDMLAAGGIMPAVFCCADEIAVAKFLDGEISFLGIYDFIKHALDRAKNMPLTIEALQELLTKKV